jgi:2,4-dienoyl-CoA reductase-like NADH-dependent reductase (Old Yellow Enzyme family)
VTSSDLAYGNTVLFSPFKSKNLELSNRIAMAPCTRMMAPDFIANDDIAAYYRRRAEGGMGLIITEGTTIDHKASNGYPNVPAFHGEKALAGWKKVVDEVHAAGGKIAPQIWHCGAARTAGAGPDPSIPAYSASGFYTGDKPNGEALSTQDAEEVIASFARAAKAAKDIGCDAVEIHGAHGYLVDGFFWDKTNLRDDRFGGSFEGRTLFGVELVKAVRAAVGPDFAVIFRHSQWKPDNYFTKVADTPALLEQWIGPLADAGVDIFHSSMRRFWLTEFDGSDLNLAGWVKKITGKPTIAVGSVGLDKDSTGLSIEEEDGTPVEQTKGASPFAHSAGVVSLERLVERMEREEFDIIAVGRASLAEPAWPNKVRDGRIAEVTPFSEEVLAELV